MAITDAAAITFANKKIRPASDKLAQAYNFAKEVKAEWVARNLGATITNTSDVIEDGSHPTARSPDGRPSNTGIQHNNIINRLTEFITDYEANNFANLNTILQVSPNPSPRI